MKGQREEREQKYQRQGVYSIRQVQVENRRGDDIDSWHSWCDEYKLGAVMKIMAIFIEG